MNMMGIIPISAFNDFIFCPQSLYLHSIYGSFQKKAYQEDTQIRGTIAHKTIDNATYSTSKSILLGKSVYSYRLRVLGKIDIFDVSKGLLVERKYKVHKIYDGFVYQLYAQMYGLEEAGYHVSSLAIHSLSDNKRYLVDVPGKETRDKFELLVLSVHMYRPNISYLPRSSKKCVGCIYRTLYSHSLC